MDLSDPNLITLKDAPMDEVKKRNEPKLMSKARIFKDLVLNLVRQNKQVFIRKQCIIKVLRRFCRHFFLPNNITFLT